MGRLAYCIAGLAGLLAPVAAHAADVNFRFRDGSTGHFYNRAHVAGTVEGTLLGLNGKGTSLPTAIRIAGAPDGLDVVPGTYTGNAFASPGITLSNGNVTAANLFFDFADAAGKSFQLRLNCTASICSDAPGLNALFKVDEAAAAGSGNQTGFAGVLYDADPSRLPEPVTWALMIIGFGAIGGVMRRKLRRSEERFTEKLRKIAAGEAE